MSIDTEKMRRAARAVGAFLRPEYGREIQAAADHIDAQAAEIAALRQPWQPIETAPRDGSWVLAWRGECRPDGEWDPMVIVCWFEFDDGPCWAWPNEVYDPWTSEGAQQALQRIEAGDWWASDDFTHWMPLPAPPAAEPGAPA